MTFLLCLSLTLLAAWTLLAALAGLALRTSLIRDGSSLARPAKAIAATGKAALLLFVGLAGFVVGRRRRSEPTDLAELVDDHAEASAISRERVETVVAEGEEKREQIVEDALGAADAIEEQANTEAEEIRSAAPDGDLEELARRFDERTGGR